MKEGENILMTGTLKDDGGPILTDAMTPEIDKKIKDACAKGDFPESIIDALDTVRL